MSIVATSAAAVRPITIWRNSGNPALADGETEGLTEALTLAEGETLADGLTLALGDTDGLPPAGAAFTFI
jgi:hypothetical protein